MVITTAETGTFQVVAVHIEATNSTVQLQGELDLAGAPVVRAALDELLADGHRFVRLDLSRLTFIDCAGLGALEYAHERFRAARGTLALTGVGPRVVKLLRITGLDEYLLVADAPGEPHRDRHLRSRPEAPIS